MRDWAVLIGSDRDREVKVMGRPPVAGHGRTRPLQRLHLLRMSPPTSRRTIIDTHGTIAADAAHRSRFGLVEEKER